jgi:hypothetical protein
MLAELRDKIVSLGESVMRAGPDVRFHPAVRVLIWLALAGLSWLIIWHSSASVWRFFQSFVF